uniref:Amino acid transporter transmembrane domain-containing protein n=1 Tax=Hyaloperonospora arabidopsidis (strain Emoy2) TaxID=559515 RepID=M4C029_HYAAE
MAFMAFANIYSSVVLSKVMLLAPNTVKTFGDLGQWSMGATGRWLCIITQMVSCLLIPCDFLVLGGHLLDGLFVHAFNQTTWIVFMALMVLPVCLVPTLKEGSGAAFAGCLGTIVADFIGVAVVMHGMRGHPSVPFPGLRFSQVVGVFGNLALAYGAGIVIPDLQRQHSDPARMPRVVGVTVAFSSILFLVVSSMAYSALGCQISGNLLFTIYPDSDTGLTSLGFEPDWGYVVLAYLFMQLHVTIAFSVILNPAFFICERLFLGMHKSVPEYIGSEFDYEENGSSGDALFANAASSDRQSKLQSNRQSNCRSKRSHLSVIDSRRVYKEFEDVEAAEYSANLINFIALRMVIIAILVGLAIIFKDHFTEFADIVGASCITISCILLPIIFYLIKAWDRVPLYESVAAITVVVVCFILGCYVTFTTGKALFSEVHEDGEFPFCEGEYKHRIYYYYYHYPDVGTHMGMNDDSSVASSD